MCTYLVSSALNLNPNYERLTQFVCFSEYSYLQPIYYYRHSRSEADVFYLIRSSLMPPPHYFDLPHNKFLSTAENQWQ